MAGRFRFRRRLFLWSFEFPAAYRSVPRAAARRRTIRKTFRRTGRVAASRARALRASSGDNFSGLSSRPNGIVARPVRALRPGPHTGRKRSPSRRAPNEPPGPGAGDDGTDDHRSRNTTTVVTATCVVTITTAEWGGAGTRCNRCVVQWVHSSCFRLLFASDKQRR